MKLYRKYVYVFMVAAILVLGFALLTACQQQPEDTINPIAGANASVTATDTAEPAMTKASETPDERWERVIATVEKSAKELGFEEANRDFTEQNRAENDSGYTSARSAFYTYINDRAIGFELVNQWEESTAKTRLDLAKKRAKKNNKLISEGKSGVASWVIRYGYGGFFGKEYNIQFGSYYLEASCELHAQVKLLDEIVQALGYLDMSEIPQDPIQAFHDLLTEDGRLGDSVGGVVSQRSFIKKGNEQVHLSCVRGIDTYTPPSKKEQEELQAAMLESRSQYTFERGTDQYEPYWHTWSVTGDGKPEYYYVNIADGDVTILFQVPIEQRAALETLIQELGY